MPTDHKHDFQSVGRRLPQAIFSTLKGSPVNGPTHSKGLPGMPMNISTQTDRALCTLTSVMPITAPASARALKWRSRTAPCPAPYKLSSKPAAPYARSSNGPRITRVMASEFMSKNNKVICQDDKRTTATRRAG